MKRVAVIFTGLLLLGVIIYIIVFIISKRKGYSPKYLVDESSIQDTVSCDPSFSLQECTELGKPCIQCRDALYSCQQVKGPEYSKDGTLISRGGITMTDSAGATFTVPEGKWCLPAKVESIPCNPYTSDPVLTKVSDSLYEWRCYCKNPQWVSSGGIDQDCNVPLMCSIDTNRDNKMVYCKDGEYKIQRKDGKIDYVCTSGQEPEEWTDKSEVSLENVFCKCSPGSYFYENKPLGIKDCIPNPCGDKPPSYDNNGNMFCVCDSGEVSCSDLPDQKRSECKIGCVKDYCIPRLISDECRDKDNPNYFSMCECKYDVDKKECVCGTAYQKINDENYITGGYCYPTDKVCPIECDCDNEECGTSFSQNCRCKRGGTCAPCLTRGGETRADYPQSFCLNCNPSLGYISDKYYPTDENRNLTGDALAEFCKKPQTDCKVCGLNFASCSSDDECCSGRCHSGTCQPCNGYNGWGDSLNEWDSNCSKTTSGKRGLCNVYLTGTEDKGDKTLNIYQGYCESRECDPDKDEGCISRDTVRGNEKRYNYEFDGTEFVGK